MATEKLTDSGIKKEIAKTELAIVTREGIPKLSLSDGQGLTLRRERSGTWLWVYRYYRADGSRTGISLGAYPFVSLSEARELHKSHLKSLKKGIDPSNERKKEKLLQSAAVLNTFESVAQAWWGVWRSSKQDKQAMRVWRFIERGVLPTIGSLPIEDISSAVAENTIDRIVQGGALDVAARTATYMRKIFDYAIVKSLIADNPMNPLDLSLTIPKREVTNHAHVPLEEMGQLLRDIDAYQTNMLHRIALQLFVLTFVRNGELRAARWQDFDFDNHLWTIPAAILDEHGQKVYGMKMSTEHYVPLSMQAIKLLQELRAITGHSAYLFPSTTAKHGVISEASLMGALKRMGYKDRQHIHGFRGLAKKALVNYLGYSEEVANLQLSHLKNNESAADRAYGSKLHIHERIEAMQVWADCLDDVRIGKRVMREIPLAEQLNKKAHSVSIDKVMRSNLKLVKSSKNR